MTKPSADAPSSKSSPRRSSTSSEQILTPSSPSRSPQGGELRYSDTLVSDSANMDDREEKPTDEPVTENAQQPSNDNDEVKKDAGAVNESKKNKSKKDCKRHSRKHKSKQSKKSKKKDAKSDSSSSDEEDEETLSTSSSADDDSSEDEKEKRKSRKHKSHKKKKRKSKSKKTKHASSESESESEEEEDSSSDESTEEEKPRRKQKKGKKSRRRRAVAEDDEEDEDEYDEYEDGEDDNMAKALAALKLNKLGGRGYRGVRRGQGRNRRRLPAELYDDDLGGYGGRGSKAKSKKKKKTAKRASTLEYKRVDQLWDSSIHNYKLTESAEDQDGEFEQYVFVIRRTFDWENRYQCSYVDIKSKILREALQEVMKDVKSVSLVEDQPSVDPNMLFLYLEEIRTYVKKTLKAKAKAEKKRKVKRRLTQMISQCKVLLRYIDEDYAEIKKTLYPMLKAGNITFDLMWALFKPNSLAYTTTYGSMEDPRCFKVDFATKESSFMRGEWYCVEGRYLEYDGKSFGLGDFTMDIESFKGPRKITSLTGYPLDYHKDTEGVKKELLERGKHFVSLEGMNYRFQKGLAFMKKKKTVAKVNINGRVMVDPQLFRRINPNYPISLIKPKDPDGMESDDESESECSCCGGSDSDEEPGAKAAKGLDTEEKGDKTKFKVIFDKQEKPHVVEVPVDAEGREIQVENIDKLPEGTDPKAKREFTEEELLITSPVVLGFAFSEKLWLEFSLKGIRDIEWNEGAFDSLVLPPNQKSIVKALVESHKFSAAKTIDDVVQGKGKGLVSVLHGPPGTGKTLTAEGIAELLKCPLYMVTAGELGTDPRILEHELQKILDIAHSWGAVLLLDEADVFLEKREVHDIHRNALVSIFLRLLEYFQGILFLTTNRVETFDDAFQSRIHVALRYGELTPKAKKSVWKMFLGKVRDMEGVETVDWQESDYDILARKNLNGRQIKNAVRTAQALAVNEKGKLSMEHIKRVMDVAESFEKDLKGGTGYEDAMRSYT